MNSLQLLLVLQSLAIGYSQLMTLLPVKEWQKMDFVFPDATTRTNAINSGAYVQNNVIPIDINIDHSKNRLFVTTPRFNLGVPVTLGYVNPPTTSGAIIPYPTYAFQSSGSGQYCDRLTSVVRIAIDECNRLWVLDAGSIGSSRICPPQIMAFDLATDKVVVRHQFAKSLYTDKSLFITPVVDLENGVCSNAKVYIADVTGFALIVFDLVKNRSWKIENKLFYPCPSYGTFPAPPFTTSSKTFDLMDGLFGLAISRNTPQASKSLYFHALASGNENVVPLSLVSNEANWLQDSNSLPNSFKTIGSRGIQTAAQALDSNGNMWFVLLNPIALVCWDTSLPYCPDNIKVVVEDNEKLQFASGLKIIKHPTAGEEVWLITNKFQKIATGTINYSEYNFRIQYRSVKELLKGNLKCNGQALRLPSPPINACC